MGTECVTGGIVADVVSLAHVAVGAGKVALAGVTGQTREAVITHTLWGSLAGQK